MLGQLSELCLCRSPVLLTLATSICYLVVWVDKLAEQAGARPLSSQLPAAAKAATNINIISHRQE